MSEEKDAMQVEEEMTAVVENANADGDEEASPPKSPLEVTEETKEVVEERPASASRTRSPEPRTRRDGKYSSLSYQEISRIGR